MSSAEGPISKQLYLYSVLLTLFRVLGVLLNGVLLAVIFANRDKVHGDTNLALTLHLSATEVLFFLPLVVLNSVFLSHGGRESLGVVGCKLFGFFSIAGSMWSVMAILWIAVDRYLVIVCGRRKSTWFWVALVAAGWLLVTVLCLAMVLSGTIFKVGSSIGYCTMDWSTRNPLGTVSIILTLSTLVIACVALVYMYWAIHARVHRVQRQFEDASGKKVNRAPGSSATYALSISNTNSIAGVDSSQQYFSAYASLPQVPNISLSPRLAGPHDGERSAENTSSPNSSKNDLERQVLLRGLAITSTFFVCWAPYAILVVMVVSGVEVPQWYDEVGGLFAASFGIVSCILSVVVDNKVFALVRHTVGR
ncbi:hypothetical protein RI367_006898 [Sorochytrium milnesiophthora]